MPLTSEQARASYASDDSTFRHLIEARRDAGLQDAQRIHRAASHPDVDQVSFLPGGGVQITQFNSVAEALQFKARFKKDGSLRSNAYVRMRSIMVELGFSEEGFNDPKYYSRGRKYSESDVFRFRHSDFVAGADVSHIVRKGVDLEMVQEDPPRSNLLVEIRTFGRRRIELNANSLYSRTNANLLSLLFRTNANVLYFADACIASQRAEATIRRCFDDSAAGVLADGRMPRRKVASRDHAGNIVAVERNPEGASPAPRARARTPTAGPGRRAFTGIVNLEEIASYVGARGGASASGALDGWASEVGREEGGRREERSEVGDRLVYRGGMGARPLKAHLPRSVIPSNYWYVSTYLTQYCQ